MSSSLFRTRRGFIALLLAASAAALTGWGVTAVATPAPNEQKLIDQLIHDVGQMHDVVFIRNGSEYSAPEAEKHLHEKMEYFKDDIHTAEDFIRLCATKSEMTGTAYRVRDAAGHVHDSAVFLKTRLDQLRGSASR